MNAVENCRNSLLLQKKIYYLVTNRACRRNLHRSSIEASALQENATVERFAEYLRSFNEAGSVRKLHARIFKHGFGDNVYLGTQLLNSYANCSLVAESRRVFGKMENRNVSLWNCCIVGYFRASCYEEVLRLYVIAKANGVGVSSSSITFSLKSCVEVGNIGFGRGIHADSLKVGLNHGKFVGSSLLGLYFGYGSFKDANKGFEEIVEKDVVSYTTMVTGCVHLGEPHAWKAFEFVRNMQREGMSGNRVTLVSLVKAAGLLGALQEGRSVHGFAVRRGIGLSDEVLQTCLVDMYAKCGVEAAAGTVLNQMERRTVASWNGSISGLIYSGNYIKALNYFCCMVHEDNVSPDSITLANLLRVFSNLNYSKHCTVVHGYLIRIDIPLDAVLTTTLVEQYARSNNMKVARKLFDCTFCKDKILYNVMVSGYLQNNTIDEAIKIFNEMIRAGIMCNTATLLCLLSTFADNLDLKRGRWIHGLIIRYGIQSDMDVSNQIVHMYAKCGHIKTARIAFNQILYKDLVSWTTIMMGYIKIGHADEAVTIFQQMLQTGEKPDSLTITTLIQANAHLGCLEPIKELHGHIYRMWLTADVATMNCLIMSYAKCGRLDIAKSVFDNIIGHELVTWNTMIAAYGIHGCYMEVLELFSQMQNERMMPDEMTFTSVLSACSHAGLLEEGWRFFHSMGANFSIIPQEQHYCCMIDLLGRAGLLEEAYHFLKCIPLADKTSATSALLAACRVHKNIKLGELIAQKLLALEPQGLGNYALASNIYAQADKWSEAANLRTKAREKGLFKMPGYSLI